MLVKTMMKMNTLTKVEKLAPLTKCTKISTLYMAHNSVKWEVYDMLWRIMLWYKVKTKDNLKDQKSNDFSKTYTWPTTQSSERDYDTKL